MTDMERVLAALRAAAEAGWVAGAYDSDPRGPTTDDRHEGIAAGVEAGLAALARKEAA